MRQRDIEERFARLEDLAEAHGLGKQPVYVAGSAALLLQGHLPATRATEDIDLMFCPPELEPFISSLDMNDDINTFEWQFPSGWQERAVRIPLDTFDIEVHALSVPDIVLSKLVSGRDLDISDIAELDAEDAVDWDTVSRIAYDPLEVQANLLPTQYADLLEGMSRFLRREADDVEDQPQGMGQEGALGTDRAPQAGHVRHRIRGR